MRERVRARVMRRMRERKGDEGESKRGRKE